MAVFYIDDKDPRREVREKTDHHYVDASGRWWQVTEQYVVDEALPRVYLVWQWITSCFGRGHWISSAPWRDKDAWRNH